MRHRRLGRVFGRSPSHRLALFRNLASALILTERDAEFDDNKPKVVGRIVTTMQKAKEVRPYVERCITIAKQGLLCEDAARQHATTADRNSEQRRAWRKGPEWQKWNQAIAPLVNARRRALRLLGDKKAVRILFSTIAPLRRSAGGLHANPAAGEAALGDAGTRAILEFVGVRDRTTQRSQAPKVESARAT